MGDPKFQRKKYETPTHPWQGPRIKEEAEIVQKYGLKNKREVWKAQTMLRKLRGQARNLQALQGQGNPQAERETKLLLNRLNRLGILDANARLDDVLALNVEAILSRRLQTQVYLRGLASTPNQARQFIVHGHVAVDGARTTVPSYLVTQNEEPLISYTDASPLTDADHPVRPRRLAEVSEVVEEVTAPAEEAEVAEPEPEEEPEGDEAETAEAEADEAEAEDDAGDEAEAESDADADDTEGEE